MNRAPLWFAANLTPTVDTMVLRRAHPPLAENPPPTASWKKKGLDSACAAIQLLDDLADVSEDFIEGRTNIMKALRIKTS